MEVETVRKAQGTRDRGRVTRRAEKAVELIIINNIISNK
jgi:hypothetical protein